MSGTPCPHCGRTIVQTAEPIDVSSPDSPDPLGGNVSALEIGQHGLDAGSRDESEARKTPLLNPTFLVVLLTIVGGLFAVGLVIGSQPGSDPEDGPETVDDEPGDGSLDGSADGSAGESQGSNLESDQQEAVDLNFPPSDDHLDADRVAEATAELFGDGGGYAVYYTTDGGVVSASADGVNKPEVQIAHTLPQVLGFPLINDGGRTWAVDREQLDTVYLVSTQFVVVDADLSGTVAFVNPSGPVTQVGVSSLGSWRPGTEIPEGSDVLAISGRGLLITPPTGGTFSFGGTGNLSRLSDDRAVAAAVGAEVYRSCDDDLQCRLYARVSDLNGDRTEVEYPLEVDDAGSVTVSPLGRFVATFPSGPGPLTIVETATGDALAVGENSILASGWAPDSSFLAIATVDELILVSPDEGEMLSVPLPAPPSAPQILVVELSP